MAGDPGIRIENSGVGDQSESHVDRPHRRDRDDTDRYNHSFSRLDLKMRLTIGSFFLLLLITAGTGLIFLWFLAIHDNPPITFYNSPFPVDKQIYNPGEIVSTFVDFCTHTSSPYTLYPEFHNSLVWRVPPTTRGGLGENTCTALWTAGTRIPKDLPPGRYRIMGITEYQVNAIAARSVAWESQFFRVVKD